MDMKPDEMLPYMKDNDKFNGKLFGKFLRESDMQKRLASTGSVETSLARSDIRSVLDECKSALQSKLQVCGIPECQSIAGSVMELIKKFEQAFDDNEGMGISSNEPHDLNLFDLLIMKSASRRATERAMSEMDAHHLAMAPEEQAPSADSGSSKWFIIAGVIALVVLLIGLLIWYFVSQKERFESDQFQSLLIDRVLNQ